MTVQALIVDDSRAMRRIIGKILKEVHVEVHEAANGLEALDFLSSQGEEVDIVLIDWNMPQMNGVELVRELRAKRQFDDLPLMMVTSETNQDNIMEAIQAGANEYVMKPFTGDVLLEKFELLDVKLH